MTRDELRYFYDHCINSPANRCKPANPPPFSEILKAWKTGRLIAYWNSASGCMRITGNSIDPKYDRDMIYRLG